MYLERTIRKRAVVEGVGLHTGEPAKLVFCPAPEGTGVYFVRRDLPGSPSLKADANFVQATTNATVLGGQAFSVSTVEHCLSALSALRIDNLFIELDGPEIPIGDGSAKVFFEAIIAAGIVEQEKPREYLYVTQPIYYGDDEKHAYVLPYNGLRISCTIDFPHQVIGKQTIDLEINEHTFSRDISSARTFGFMKDVEMLKSMGLIKGGSLDNAVVLDDHEVLNPEGLRYANEFVRHKVLDACGDLVTLGAPLLGHVVLYKAGHDVMNRLVKKIRSTPESFRYIELGADLPMDAIDSGHYLWAY
ncbi:MAG: UDP-3-O-acyl-N-acetylglucosamine deacetylase [Bdellovibrionaceae bacterium]|mgnify:CR=1 FL=1|jgi:UDP-3-O-[3-hydroxymyristoyl] N-acetylglucosamine deacetylase|nr:UDP-3-O-acyl-N-acetylglucosamine deacetylase [Pseudobdellovibrionaceae bacterium]